MSKLSLKLQKESLAHMRDIEPYQRALTDIEYTVLPRVYKGGSDTVLLCSLLNIQKGQSVWDVGTGTGLVALTAKKAGAGYVLATDLNRNAIKNAKENAKKLNLDIDIREADVFGDIAVKVDLITFNPPFTDAKASEEHEISFWDKDHKTLRKFFKTYRDHLKPKGRALICWSSFGDVRKLRAIGREFNLHFKKLGEKKGKLNFKYYVFEIITP